MMSPGTDKSNKKSGAGAKPAPKASVKPQAPAPPKPVRYRVSGCTVICNHVSYPHGSLLPDDFPPEDIPRLLKLDAIEQIPTSGK